MTRRLARRTPHGPVLRGGAGQGVAPRQVRGLGAVTCRMTPGGALAVT
ncbi:hypothetical protein [Deinococcus soli (ex Cha et al. 2016)]|nr:hypothetical protein [Deinococcus soli (ex Cha et al. 2016)]